MLMYNKDSDVGVTVSQAQVKTLEKAGWSKTIQKEIKPEKVVEEAVKVQAKIETKAAEAQAKKAVVKPVVAKPAIK